MRTIADIYQKKLKEDAVADSKRKQRMPVGKFVREYLMRQYGMKSMAEKAMRELTFTIRSYADDSGGEELLRAKLFGEMLGMLNRKEPWKERKVNFFLLALGRFLRKDGAEALSKASDSSGRSGSINAESFARRRRSSTVAGAGGAPKSGASDNLKEILSREEVTVTLAHATAVLEVLITEKPTRQGIVSKFKEAAVDKSEKDDRGKEIVTKVLSVPAAAPHTHTSPHVSPAPTPCRCCLWTRRCRR